MPKKAMNEGEGKAIAGSQWPPILFSLPAATLRDLWEDEGPMNNSWSTRDVVMEPASSSSSQAPMEVDGPAIAAAKEPAAKATVSSALPVAETVKPAAPEPEIESDDKYGAVEHLSPRLTEVVAAAVTGLSPKEKDRLRRILSSLDMLSWICCNNFASAKEFQAAAEQFCVNNRLRISGPMRVACSQIWAACDQISQRKVRARVEAPVTAAPKTSIQVPVLQPPPRDKPPSSTNPYFQKGSKVPTVLKPAVSQRQHVEDYVAAMETVKHNALTELYNFGMTIENSGLAKEAVGATEAVLSKLKVLFLWDNRDLEAHNINDKLRLARRYSAWMREAEFLPWNPEQWQLRLFILEQHNRGSSVPKSSLQALQWLGGKLRFDIGANEQEVKPTATAAQTGSPSHHKGMVDTGVSLSLGKRISRRPRCNLDPHDHYILAFRSYPKKLHC